MHHEWCDGEGHEDHGRTDERVGCEQPDEIPVEASHVIVHEYLQIYDKLKLCLDQDIIVLAMIKLSDHLTTALVASTAGALVYLYEENSIRR